MNNYIELNNKVENINLEDFLDSKDISGRMFRKLLKAKNIRINGLVAKNRKALLKVGDIIKLSIPDEELDIEPEELNIEILYENKDIIAINKEPFMVVHPTSNITNKTLSNGLAYYFLKTNIKSKVRLINRLDRDTSGVILFAKNSFGHQQVAKQLENKTAIKKYYALVEGTPNNKEGIINKPIGKCEEGMGQCIRKDGLESITKYKVIEEYKNASLLELEIVTGRTHQIRVHLKDLGHPIIGDTLYNNQCKSIGRQALHASSITIKNTRTDEILTVVAPLPSDMVELMDILKVT